MARTAATYPDKNHFDFRQKPYNPLAQNLNFEVYAHLSVGVLLNMVCTKRILRTEYA